MPQAKKHPKTLREHLFQKSHFLFRVHYSVFCRESYTKQAYQKANCTSFIHSDLLPNNSKGEIKHKNQEEKQQQRTQSI